MWVLNVCGKLCFRMKNTRYNKFATLVAFNRNVKKKACACDDRQFILIYSTKVGIDKTATKLIQSENIGKELGGSRDGGGSKKGFRHLQL